MNSRIHYSVDQGGIRDTQRYTLVRLNDKIKCDKKDKIADKILKASDKMICKASGLYVNDNFIGAVKDDLALQRLLDNYLDPYKELYPDDEVRFVDDVSVKKGYYLTDSVCKLEKLNERISNNVQYFDRLIKHLWVNEILVPTEKKHVESPSLIIKDKKDKQVLKLLSPQECFSCDMYNAYCIHCLGAEEREGHRYVVCDYFKNNIKDSCGTGINRQTTHMI